MGRLRLPPARRDVFGGDGDRLEARVREGERRGGRAQGRAMSGHLRDATG